METVATKENTERERDVPMRLTIICNISSITYSYCLVVPICLVASFVDFFLLNSLVHGAVVHESNESRVCLASYRGIRGCSDLVMAKAADFVTRINSVHAVTTPLPEDTDVNAKSFHASF